MGVEGLHEPLGPVKIEIVLKPAPQKAKALKLEHLLELLLQVLVPPLHGRQGVLLLVAKAVPGISQDSLKEPM